jgi:hypothetical protein
MLSAPHQTRRAETEGRTVLKAYSSLASLGLALALTGACSSGAEVHRGDGDGAATGAGGDGGGDGAGGDGTSGNGGTGAGGIQIGGGAVGGMGAADGGSDPSRPGNECAAATADVKPVNLDIALLVDTSYSMDFDLRWQYVKGALLSFVDAPGQKDLGLSLQFFPLRAQCDVDAYSTPALPMANVGDARTDVETTVNARRMSGGTPIVQALAGMGRYAAAWAKQHPDRRTAIVVATDGVPDSTCSSAASTPPNDLTNAAKTAKALATGSPAIPVFVIGVGKELDSLNTIAVAGGTDRAVLIQDGENAQKEFLEALENIRKSSLGCEYLIPASTEGKIDFDTVNVQFTEGKRAPATFLYAGDAGSCSLEPDQAWYYDDPDAPTKVILCPETCSRVANATDASIDIAYGCERRNIR